MLGYGGLGKIALGAGPSNGNIVVDKTVNVTCTGTVSAFKAVAKLASLASTGAVTQGAKDIGRIAQIAASATVAAFKAVSFSVSLASTAAVTIATPRDVVQAVSVLASGAVAAFKSAAFSVGIAATGAVTQGAKAIAHAQQFAVSAAVTTIKAITFLVGLISATALVLVGRGFAQTLSITVFNVVTQTKNVGRIISTIPIICSISKSLALLRVTSRLILQDVVDCVLAGETPLKERGREWEIPAPRTTESTIMSRSGGLRRSGPKPSFTVKTSNRGHD